MKLLSTYIKEMKIAFRGFYFYIEVVMAVIILTILLVAVKENPVSNDQEFVFYDMDSEIVDAYYEDDFENGTMIKVDPVEFEVNNQEIEIINKETGETQSLEFEKGIIEVEAIEVYDKETGEFDKMMYLTDTEEDMIRLAYDDKSIGAKVWLDDEWTSHYQYYTQGYETEKNAELTIYSA